MAQDLEGYQALLQKARASLPENVHNKERWELPVPETIKEGRMTILRNFRDIVGALRRNEQDVSKYLLAQIGTAGNIDGDRLIMTGRVSPEQVQDKLQDFIAIYVQCAECGSPDTHLEKDGRTALLKCEACGAHQPIKLRKRRSDD